MGQILTIPPPWIYMTDESVSSVICDHNNNELVFDTVDEAIRNLFLRIVANSHINLKFHKHKLNLYGRIENIAIIFQKINKKDKWINDWHRKIFLIFRRGIKLGKSKSALQLAALDDAREMLANYKDIISQCIKDYLMTINIDQDFLETGNENIYWSIADVLNKKKTKMSLKFRRIQKIEWRCRHKWHETNITAIFIWIY